MSALIAETPEEQNVSLIDDWTAAHAAVGFGAGILGLNSGLFALGMIAYEAIQLYGEGEPDWLFITKEPETLGNAATDIVAGLVGYYTARLVIRAVRL